MWYKFWLLLWLLWKRPWRPAVVPADWGKPPKDRPVYFWYREDGVISCDVDVTNAVNQANTESLARGDWPATAIVFSRPPYDAPTVPCPVVYGPCLDCGFCTHKDREGNCMPCQSARNVHPTDRGRQRGLARAISIQLNPAWFGFSVEEMRERQQRFDKQARAIQERRNVEDSQGPPVEGSEEIDDSCSA